MLGRSNFEHSVGNNGLTLKLTSNGRTELEEILDAHPEWPDHLVFGELFEHELTNGWAWLSAEQVGGLTSCQIIISPDAEFDDQGELCHANTVYWHERYQVESASEVLRETGQLFLLRA